MASHFFKGRLSLPSYSAIPHRLAVVFHKRSAHLSWNQFNHTPTTIVTIKTTLQQIISGDRNYQAVNHLVHVCFKIALAYLHHRLRRGSLADNQFGISNEDLALDCIAELYQRDEAGRYTVLLQYFESAKWETLTENELKIALRRLVFSKVNEGLFRNYREEDPNLAKIIRNVKEAAKQDKRVRLVKTRDTSWLVVGPAGTELNHLPIAPPEILEAFLLGIVCNTSNTYRAVSSLADFVAEHPHYSNGYPMSAFAQILRSSFLGRTPVLEHTETPSYETIEVENAIQRAVNSVRNSLHDSYVRGGKLSLTLFNNYVDAVKKILKSTFTLYPDATDSQFEALQTIMPGLSKDAYMRQHRNILQYMFKLSRIEMLAYLKDE